MARKRVCLAGFIEGEGPWVIATGKEGAARVSPLLDGEEVRLETEGALGTVHCQSGFSVIKLEQGKKYRFVKVVRDGVKPSRTCVEVLFNE